MELEVGKVYRNKKHGTLYHVLGFSMHSEEEEILVQYERVEPEERNNIPWSRPAQLFTEKFEEVQEEDINEV